MAWSLDHVAIPSYDVPATVAFFRDVFGVARTDFVLAEHARQPDTGEESFAPLEDASGRGIHVLKPVPNFFRRFGLEVNPAVAHFAITVDDLAPVKRALDEREWLYSEAGEWGPAGFHRMYTQDPFLNTIEINQRIR
jgi:catechol 2,3-dioxygenase-like lactoylglutathione lyase family enzyme